jgi:hypothetical protein
VRPATMVGAPKSAAVAAAASRPTSRPRICLVPSSPFGVALCRHASFGPAVPRWIVRCDVGGAKLHPMSQRERAGIQSTVRRPAVIRW